MKWVTTDNVHLDRVACPWLIRRFVDPQAEFTFVTRDKQDQLPQGATPFAIVGAELGPHEAGETTFHKIIKKYNLDDAALAIMASVVGSGVHHALHKGKEDVNDVDALEGIGLDALSEGMMLTSEGDINNIDQSMAMYDALYAYCKAHVLVKEDPSLAQTPLFERARRMKPAIKAALTKL